MDAKEKYSYLSTIVLHESKAMWETSNLFLLANTILATFIGTSFLNNFKKGFEYSFIFFMLPFLGFIISVLWMFSYKRTSKYYKFRMAQIRELEKRINKGGVDIFAGKPKEVSDGNKVIIDNEIYCVRVLGWNFRSFLIVDIIIYFFILFFLVVTLLVFPWRIYFV